MGDDHKNGGNGRVTIARVSQQVTDLDRAFGDLRHSLGDHIRDGQQVLQRLASVEARIDMAMKIMPVVLAAAALAVSVYIAFLR